MALIEDAIGGWGGGLLIGLGAVLVGPTVIPAAGNALRPVAKMLVKGALAVTDGVRTLAAEASEQASDLVAEVRSEGGSRARASRGGHNRSRSTH